MEENKMAKIFYESDCDLSLLDGKTVAIIGYGSQGHAHALNLKESGVKVIVGLYEGSKSWKRAEEQGIQRIYRYSYDEQGRVDGKTVLDADRNIVLKDTIIMMNMAIGRQG